MSKRQWVISFMRLHKRVFVYGFIGHVRQGSDQPTNIDYRGLPSFKNRGSEKVGGCMYALCSSGFTR